MQPKADLARRRESRRRRHNSLFEDVNYMVKSTSGVPKGGEWGVRTPHFSKIWSSRFTRKCNKIGGGGGFGQICQEVVSEILEKQAKNCFSRVGSKVLVSKKCSNSAGRGILSPK